MKQLPHPSSIIPAALLFLLTGVCTHQAGAGWASARLATARDVFAFADVDRSNNLDTGERDRLRLAFKVRDDFRMLDLNRNNKLDREEIDYLEKKSKKKKKKGDKSDRT